jgi:L-ascorbate metabolism protein UlaG (beta-lactamase superfamily)
MVSMNKTLSIIAVLAPVLFIGYLFMMKAPPQAPSLPVAPEENVLTVHPIMHATMVLDWGGAIIYTDPVGALDQFKNMKPADVILVTDIHGDHLSTSTLTQLVASGTVIIAPMAVAEKLTPMLRAQTVMLANGATTSQKGFLFEAIPMYNLPESAESAHTKGRGNGYIASRDGKRVYVAGDTADIPEMRALKDIDTAFIPMNLPYTMTVESAAEGVLAFGPKHVYPYHYRGKDGLADVARFKQLVQAANPAIDVVLEDWYPSKQ